MRCPRSRVVGCRVVAKEKAEASRSPGSVNVECKFFKRGKCHKGEKCRFVHTGQPCSSHWKRQRIQR